MNRGLPWDVGGQRPESEAAGLHSASIEACQLYDDCLPAYY